MTSNYRIRGTRLVTIRPTDMDIALASLLPGEQIDSYIPHCPTGQRHWAEFVTASGIRGIIDEVYEYTREDMDAQLAKLAAQDEDDPLVIDLVSQPDPTGEWIARAHDSACTYALVLRANGLIDVIPQSEK